ncbi:hypothetical protein KI387_028747, partial [Taxus chinensis]
GPRHGALRSDETSLGATESEESHVKDMGCLGLRALKRLRLEVHGTEPTTPTCHGSLVNISGGLVLVPYAPCAFGIPHPG